MTKRLVSIVASLLLAVAACGGSSKSQPTTPAVAEPVPAAEVAPAKDPAAPLTEAQCTEAVDHAIALMETDEQAKAYVPKMHEGHDEFVADCTKKATQKDYDCLMAAKTFAELGSCEEPKQ